LRKIRPNLRIWYTQFNLMRHFQRMNMWCAYKKDLEYFHGEFVILIFFVRCSCFNTILRILCHGQLSQHHSRIIKERSKHYYRKTYQSSEIKVCVCMSILCPFACDNCDIMTGDPSDIVTLWLGILATLWLGILATLWRETLMTAESASQLIRV